MELQRNKDITRYSAYKTKATSEFFVEITDISELWELANIVQKMQNELLPIVYIAWGTNLLFAFDHFKGLIVHIRMSGARFYPNPKKGANNMMFTAFAGTPIAQVVTEAIEKYSAQCLLPWVGLPGTVGGAIVGNAGCFWLETSDILREVQVFDVQSGDFKTFLNSELQFGYRKSILKNQDRYILISGTFDLSLGRSDNPYVSKTVDEMRVIRREKQPPGISCGSFFTNPSGFSAGKLIDDAEMKWLTVGGVQISPLHGNFFINTWGASWADVIKLAQCAKAKVWELFQIELSEEVRIIPWNGVKISLSEVNLD